MKEATGDLNMTVIVVLLVAVMVAFFSMYLWPMIRGGIKNDGNCSDAICKKDNCSEGICDCDYYPIDPNTKKKSTTSIKIKCPNKG